MQNVHHDFGENSSSSGLCGHHVLHIFKQKTAQPHTLLSADAVVLNTGEADDELVNIGENSNRDKIGKFK